MASAKETAKKQTKKRRRRSASGRLVVVVSIDQMRYDYLVRFKKLLSLTPRPEAS